MNIKQKSRFKVTLSFALLLVATFVTSIGMVPAAYADPAISNVKCKDGTSQEVHKTDKPDTSVMDEKDYKYACRNHGGYEATEPSPSPDTDACKVKTAIIPVDCSKGDNPIWGLLLLVVNILTAGIGIVAIGGIIYAAILWTTAADKNAQIVKSKETIFNVVLGLVAFALFWAFLQFLIPGGVLSV